MNRLFSQKFFYQGAYPNMDLIQKRCFIRNKATICFLWCASLCRRHHFCFVHGNRKCRYGNMERPVLDHSIIYQHQCSGQKFFAGKQKQDVVLSNHFKSGKFYSGKAFIQFCFDAGNERTQFHLIFPVHEISG